MNKFTQTVSALLFFSLMLNFSASATVFTVNTTADTHAANALNGSGVDGTGHFSLRSVLETIDSVGGTHTINLPANTYNLTLGRLSVGYVRSATVTILGGGASTTIVNMVANVSQDRILVINGQTGLVTNINIIINDVSFTGGKLTSDPFGGAAISGGGINNTITLKRCIFQNNSIPAGNGSGGAVNCQFGGTLSIDSCAFSNNTTADAVGGAVYYIFFASGAQFAPTNVVNITNSTFTNNSTTASSSSGGAIGINMAGNPGGATFSGSILKNTFTGNTANASLDQGGAIEIVNSFAVGNTIQVHYNRFVNNASTLPPNALFMADTQGSVDATDNWWGCNGGPAAAGCDKASRAPGALPGTLNTSSWLQLKATVVPNPVCSGSNTTVTGGFLTNNLGTAISAANLTALYGVPISFQNPILGTLSGAQTTIQPTGTATVTYAAGGTAGAGSVNAVVDNVPANDVAPAKVAITVNKVSLTNPVGNTGTVNTPFSQTFTQSGGALPVTFALIAGTLPTGLTLAGSGVLSGTPTQSGNFPITVKVTDNSFCIGVGLQYNLSIACQTITVNNPGVTSGIAGASFGQNFTAPNAVGTATFSLNSGSLPSGISLSSTGLLGGTPTQTGNFPITVKVTDGNGCTGISGTYTLVINCQTITITNPSIATGTNGTPFNQTFTQTGAIGSALFSLLSGPLPNALTLSAGGVLSGTPSAPAASYPVTVKVTDINGCSGTSPYNFTLSCQSILVSNPATTTGQQNVPFNQSFSQTGGIGGITFTTASPLPNGLTLSTAGVLAGTPLQSGPFPLVVKATDANGCFGNGATYNLNINACPVITVSNPGTTTGTVGTAFSQTFTQSGGGLPVTFSTSSTLPAGLSLTTAGVLSGTPTQGGTFPIVVTVTDLNLCTGNSPTYNLVISCPAVSVNAVSSQVVCNGTSTSAVTFSGSPAGTVFNWTNSAPSIGLAANGSGNIASFTATNTGNSPVVASITVTPTFGLNCNGTPVTFTITVNPTPTAIATPSSQVVCSGTAITTIVFSGNIPAANLSGKTQVETGVFGSLVVLPSTSVPNNLVGTVYNWARDNTVAVTGIAASGSGNISGSLTNTTNAPVTVTFIITPSYSNAGTTCSGTPITATVVVNPTPNAVATPPSQTKCSGDAITTIVLTGNVPGTVYNWTRDNTVAVTGIAASGSGNISGSLTNTTNAPVTVTFTITPSYTNAGTTCSGTQITSTVVVNPTPNAVATPSSQTKCSGSSITTIVLTGNVTGTVYNWTRDNTVAATGIPVSGSGNISGTLTNTTNAPVTVTFTITPSYTNAGTTCSGTPITATVVVNPTPNAVATPPSQTKCSGGPITTIVLTGNVAGTVYNWTRDNTVAVTGIAASGSGNISGSLTNTTNAPVTVTFTITPSFTNAGTTCSGTPITATVVVNPTPNAVATPPSQTKCSGDAITTIALTGNVTGTIYNWTRDNTVAVTGIAASGSGNISGSLTNTTNAPVTVTFTITPSFTNAGTTCGGTPITATVLVNPSPAAITGAGNVCLGSTITLSDASPGGTWTSGDITKATVGASTGIVTGVSAGSVTITYTLTGGCFVTAVVTVITTHESPLAQAYSSNIQTGNQAYQGELGMEFIVNEPGGILIRQLGAFDDGGNGITGLQPGGSVRVAIFNRSTHAIVPGLNVTISGNGDAYTGNHRMVNLASPVTLPPGDYVIVAKGYHAGERNGNSLNGGALYPAGDDGGGAITFGNETSYGPDDPNGFNYPTNAGNFGSTHIFLAGTFEFTTVIPCSPSASGCESAAAQAYSSNTSTGNNAHRGELGMEFMVTNPGGINIKQLGAFDDGGNGITGLQPGGGVRVAIFNRSTHVIVPGLDVTISGTAGILAGNHRLVDITPVTLPPGDYVIVAKGYNAAERNGNSFQGGGPFTAGNTGGGAIAFGNETSYGPDDPNGFSYPNAALNLADTHVFLAGTFNFTAVLPCAGACESPDAQAYVSNTQTGNQAHRGELGLEFIVNHPGGINIKQLGAFDDGGNGITGLQPGGGVRVAIFNRNTHVMVPGLDVTIIGNVGHYTGNHRMVDITPVVLPPGDYVIVAKGYNAAERNGNSFQGGGPYPTGDNGGSAITYGNEASYGPDDPNGFSYPGSSVNIGDPHVFLAGSFDFTINVNCVTAPIATTIDPVTKGPQPVLTIKAKDLQVYPNPTKGQFTLKLDGLSASKITVQIMNSNGKMVEQRTIGLTGKTASLGIPFNLADQPAGMYLIKVVSADGIQTGKFVIRR